MTTATVTDPDKTPVAGDVMTMCTKEKAETWHVVMVHNTKGLVDRVKCKSCGSEHKYKSKKVPFVAKATASSVTRKIGQTSLSSATRAAANSALTEENWLAGLKKWGGKDVTDFTPDRTYKVGEVFAHSHFGKGVVQGRRENKVDVLFQQGIKTLPSKPADR